METSTNKKPSKIPGRGIIKSKSDNCYYYIINELFDFGELKSFTASKFHIEDEERIFDTKKYLIKYISLDWIRINIFKKFKMIKISEENFFQNILKNYTFIKEKIKSDYIQKLYDCIIDNQGIYIVLEYFDKSLKDYTSELKDSIKNFNTFPFEVKIRKIISQTLEITNYIHSEKNLFFGVLLNSYEIMIQEVESGLYSSSSEEKKGNEIIVKFPNPFMSDILTIFYLSDSKLNNYFPSYLAPEILFHFDQSMSKQHTYDFSTLINKFSHNTDMWSLGYLTYELLFDEQPFIFDSCSSAIKSLNENFSYEIYPHKVSKCVLAIIIKCLQLNSSCRMDYVLSNGIKNSLKNESDNLEGIEMALKKNIEAKEKDTNKGLCKFDIVSDNGYDFRDL